MAVPDDPTESILRISQQMRNLTRKDELGTFLVAVFKRYDMYDLQLINGKIERDLRDVPLVYRKKIMPFLREWIFGRYHLALLLERNKKISSFSESITDPKIYSSFCEMLPSGCISISEKHDPYPPDHAAWYNLFMFLMAGFAMYVLDEPGHPEGTPFPGGGLVKKKGAQYYCPIRDKEEEIFYSICNYCPALQEPDI